MSDSTASVPELGQLTFGNKWETHEAPDFVARGLYDLSELLGRRNPEAQSHGFLGGEYGYGQEFDNETFAMFPYWWGDCTCGFEQREHDWCAVTAHDPDCYQSELERRMEAAERLSPLDLAPVLAREWGLPEFGSAVHCTCGYQKAWEAWRSENDHDPACPIVRPNFEHKPSGLRVHWYKYIGRSMTTNRPISFEEWRAIVRECERSVGVE